MKLAFNDFPDWYGPMLVKELRQGLKAKGFVLSFLVLQLVLILVFIYHVTLYSKADTGFDATGLGVIFWALIGLQLLAITPLRALNELASERKADTLELIFLSGLSATRIIFGKWVSLFFQGILFLLAVLPYAILRYYFGGVDLTEDLTLLTFLVLASAVLTALCLAVSGLHLFFRLIAALGYLFFLLGTLPSVVMGRIFYGMVGSTPEINWWAILYAFIFVWLISLELAAATISPPAENHAGRVRLLSFFLLLPLPLCYWLRSSEAVFATFIILFLGVAGFISWLHLAIKPHLQRSHLTPFRGYRSFVGILFQPGWPSAMLYVLVAIALAWVPVKRVAGSGDDHVWFQTVVTMIAASLFCSASAWVTFRRRAKQPLVEQTIFLVLCGSAVAIITAAQPYNQHIGEFLSLGFLPPVALFAMLDDGVASAWRTVALVALSAYALYLLLRSRSYWAEYFKRALAVAPSDKQPLVAPQPSTTGE